MPFPLMTLRSLQSIALLSALALPVLLPAQAVSSSEEERLEKLMANSAQWYVPRTTVSVGFRMLTSGGKVSFDNLGTVDLGEIVAPITDGAVTRAYHNGVVVADAPRGSEKDAEGNVVTTPGTRYATTATVNVLDADGNPVLDADGKNVTTTQQSGDFLAYTPGLTRNWGYSLPSQVTADGHVAMSTYSATSEGGTAMKEAGASAGVEFQYAYNFSNPAKRLQWGMLAGVTLNSINSKTSGTVTSTLHTRTDYYSLNGQTAPEAPYDTGTAFVDFIGADGTVYVNGKETTVSLAAVPDQPTTESDTTGGVNVNGNWQVRGAYFMMRFGPSIRARLTNRLGMSASAGVAGAYAGTTYSVRETFQVPDLPDLVVDTQTVQSTEAKFIAGYYADLNLEWAANERTGLFGGVTAQKFDGYDQSVGTRTARVDLGSSVGLRGGVSIRF